MTTGTAAAAVTSLGSWHVSLWTDEAATISAAGRSLPELWRMLGSIDAVHGAYYALMHVWTRVFGFSPFALRLPSALAVGVATAGVFMLALRLAGPRAALPAAVVFVLLPRASWSGIEARPYAVTAALAVWATAVLLRAVERPRAVGNWIGYAILVAAGVYANIYLGLLAVGHLVALLTDRRVPRRALLPWAISAGSAALLALPLALTATGQTGQLGGDQVRLSALARNVAVNQWFLGDTPTTTTGVTVSRFSASDVGSWWAPASVVLALLCWGLVVFALVPARRGRGMPHGNPGVRTAVWCLPWILVPTAVIGAYSVLVHPMYSPRYLTFAAPGVAILVAGGLSRVTRRGWAAGLFLLLVASALPVLVSQRQLYAKNSSDWATAAQVVGARAQRPGGVYFAPRYAAAVGPTGQTTRGIATAYPGAFAGLVDLTLDRTAVEADNLTGFSRPISRSGVLVDEVSSIWLLRRRDYPPANATSDDAYLSSRGFTSELVWQGPVDEVLHYYRQ